MSSKKSYIYETLIVWLIWEGIHCSHVALGVRKKAIARNIRGNSRQEQLISIAALDSCICSISRSTITCMHTKSTSHLEQPRICAVRMARTLFSKYKFKILLSSRLLFTDADWQRGWSGQWNHSWYVYVCQQHSCTCFEEHFNYNFIILE